MNKIELVDEICPCGGLIQVSEKRNQVEKTCLKCRKTRGDTSVSSLIMIRAFPKIFTIGQNYITDIFKEEVEITEKIDGSQLSFGKIDGGLFIRSKGTQIFPETPQEMFKKGINYILEIQDKIKDNTIYYCEYLNNPSHNIIGYDRVPKNYLILFGVSEQTGTKFISKHKELKKYAKKLEIEVVPELFSGKIKNQEELLKLLDTDSVLGKSKIEGLVVKNYFRSFLLGGQPIPIMMGKYVNEKFKETHREKWGKEFTSKGKWETFKESFRTEARWQKAIQHFKEKGELENSPRDIGKLLKEIQIDIEAEEKEDIKNFLWKEFGQEVLRYSTKGFPEFYKKELLKRAFVSKKMNKTKK